MNYTISLPAIEYTIGIKGIIVVIILLFIFYLWFSSKILRK
jgi:hypothetical protein